MPLVINTNVGSLNAQRNLVKSGMEMSTAMERLSSGLRINRAADDAAGLAISNRLTSSIRGLNQAVRNANDGLSLISTAEGAMAESTNILQRVRELAIQSANGIYSDSDRATLNAEVQQLISELDRIAETTTFNGRSLLDGSFGKSELQVGTEANQTISVEIGALDAKTLGMGSTSVDMMGDANDLATKFAASATALVQNDVLINGQSVMGVGESWNATDDEMDDLLSKINANVNGVTASMTAVVTAETAGDGVLVKGTDTLTLTINKLNGTSSQINITDTASLSEMVDKLNAEGGGLISAAINDNGKLEISAQDAEAITVTTDVTGATGTLNTTQGSLVLTSDNGDPIEITRGSSGTLADLNAFGFRENDDPGIIEGVAVNTTAFAVGDLRINGVDIGASDTGGLVDKLKAINAVSDDTGVTAVAFTSLALDFSGVDLGDIGSADAINLNGITLDFSGLSTGDNLSEIVDEFNSATDETGVTAQLIGTRVVLEGDVTKIKFTNAATATDDLAAWETAGVEMTSGSADTVTALTATGSEVDGGIKLVSENGNPISVELAANGTAAEKTAAIAKAGLVESNAGVGGAFGSSLSSISVATASSAQKALDVIDNALNTISDTRAQLGAVSNRLQFTVSNLMNVSENTAAARSRIMDADFAAETAALSKAQVLQQASSAMLAQANAAPQLVLSLLR